MKRKFFSVLLALVLVASLALIPTGVSASPNDVTLQAGGDGIAEWSCAENNSGSSSVFLSSPKDLTGSGDDYARITTEQTMAFEDLSAFSFYFKQATGMEVPYHIVAVDLGGVQSWDIYDSPSTHGVQNVYKVKLVHASPDWNSKTETNYGTWVKFEETGGVPNTVITTSAWNIHCYDATDTWIGMAGDSWWKYYTWTEAHTLVDLSGASTVTHAKVELAYTSVEAASAYVDDVTINTTTYNVELPAARPLTVDDDRAELATAYFQTIGGAIDCAVAGETIQVYAGTYNAASGETFPIDVDIANLTIKSASGAASTIVEPTSSDESGFNVTAAGVTIGGSGFTITSGGRAGIYADVTGGNGITVQDCIFKSYADGESRGMWFEKLWNGALVTGNSFTTPRVGTGIMVVNADGATISNNTVAAGTEVKYSFLTFKAEAFYPLRNPPTPFAEYCPTSASTINNVLVTGNSITGMDATRHAITFGASTKTADHGEPQAQDLTVGSGGVTISRNTFANTVSGGSVGVEIEGDEAAPNDANQVAHIYGVANILINYNSFTGTTTPYYAVDNNQTTIVNAKYNWWDAVSGPVDDESKNPYRSEAITAEAEKCHNADFLPWMIHTELVSGWNIYSTPIAPGAASNTVEKALDLWGSGTDNFTIGWYFDGATQDWVQVLSTTALQPMQAVYLKMTAAATVDVVLSAEYTSPPQAVMGAGWNLIGPAALEPMLVEDALLSAKFGAGAPDLWGYSQAHSPALHQTLWTFQREDTTPSSLNLIPTEGYWVHMVNAGLLAGFTSTPIEP